MVEKEHDPGEKEEFPQELRFIVTNDSTHDFDLTLEVVVGHNQLLGAIYRVGWGSAEEWHVSFAGRQHIGTKGIELSWETFQKIYQKFAEFREQMATGTENIQDPG